MTTIAEVCDAIKDIGPMTDDEIVMLLKIIKDNLEPTFWMQFKSIYMQSVNENVPEDQRDRFVHILERIFQDD